MNPIKQALDNANPDKIKIKLKPKLQIQLKPKEFFKKVSGSRLAEEQSNQANG